MHQNLTPESLRADGRKASHVGLAVSGPGGDHR